MKRYWQVEHFKQKNILKKQGENQKRLGFSFDINFMFIDSVDEKSQIFYFTFTLFFLIILIILCLKSSNLDIFPLKEKSLSVMY